MKNLISIIVPIYNAETYLKQCVISILNQTYEDFELWLIDDGSTDCSKEICLEFAQKDKRVQYIEKQNEGVSATRNLGLDLARGKYVAFIDSDDFIENNYLEELYQAIEKSENSISMCAFSYYDNGKNEAFPSNEKLAAYTKGDNLFETFLKKIVVEKTAFGPVWRTLVPLKIIKENNLRFPSCRYAEDSIFFFSLLGKCENVRVVDKPLYFYRMHNASATHKKYIDNLLSDRLIYLEVLKESLSVCDLNAGEYREIYSIRFLETWLWVYFNALNAPTRVERKREIREIRQSVFGKSFKKEISKQEYKAWRLSLNRKKKLKATIIHCRMLGFCYFIKKILGK